MLLIPSDELATGVNSHLNKHEVALLIKLMVR